MYDCVGMPGIKVREVLGVVDIDIVMSAMKKEVIELWMRGSHSEALNWHAPSHQRDDQTIVARELEPDRVQGDAEDKRTQFAHLLPLLVIDVDLENIQHSLGILRSMCKQTSWTLSTDGE